MSLVRKPLLNYLNLQIRQRKLRKTYKNQLMLSEWLVEVPEDMAEKWLLILCPEVNCEALIVIACYNSELITGT